MADAPLPVNQTHFSYEEPLFEQPPQLQPESDEVEVKAVWFKTKKGVLIIASAIVGLLVLLIAAMAYYAPRTMPRIQDVVTNSPVPSPILTPNQIKINDLKTELDAADPAKQDFPFPPVMMDITLPDPNQRR